MSASCWQHEITRMNVVAYAVGGDSAADRMPRAQGDQGPVSEDSIGWANAHGEWRLKNPPKITPEEDQRRKERAISQLLGLSKLNAQANKGKYPRAPGDASSGQQGAGMGTFEQQLAQANNRADGEG